MRTPFAAGLAALSLVALPTSVQSQQDSLANPLSAFAKPGERNNWHLEIAPTERGHLIGNPDAEAKLILFTSYTCEECADFERQGGGALDLALLAPGLMSVEVRPRMRNAIDLTVALLAQCGGIDGFRNRHRLFLTRQDRWLAKAQSAPHSQRIYWERGDRRSRVSVAATLDLDDMLADRGVTRAEINRCLNDEMAARALRAKAEADAQDFALPDMADTNKPTFVLNGELLEGVHDWNALYTVLAKGFHPETGRFRPETER